MNIGSRSINKTSVQLAVLSTALFLGGCGIVGKKNQDELVSRSTTQDWGVLDRNHQTAERAAILQTLKDPDSAKIRFTQPTRGVSHSLGEPVLAWYSMVYVNAKNSFGGYVGEKPYGFAYRCPVNKSCQLINYGIPDHDDSDEIDWQK